MKILGTLLMLIPVFAHAGNASLSPPAAAKPLIIFFGGFGATSGDAKTWENGCRSSHGRQYDFEGNRYYGGANSETSAINGAKARIDHYVKMITANPQREYIIVGHSAGGVVPAALARRLPAGAKVKLVTLDSFRSGSSMQDKFPTVCYSALNSMAGCRNRVQFSPGGCRSKMCRHFRMLNKGAPSNADIGTGYSGFSCNLDWMQRFPGAHRSEAETESVTQ